MPAVEWRAPARADLLAIIDYISDDNPDAAQHLKDEVEGKAGRLADHPQLYKAGRVDGTREMIVHPNYLVIYTEHAEVVSILRVLHASQQWPPTGDND